MSKGVNLSNVVEARKVLEVTLTKLNNQEIDYKTASVFKGTVATVIQGAKAQVDYQKMRGTKNTISFLEE